MITVTNKPEEYLTEYLGSARQNHHPVYCVHIHGNQLGPDAFANLPLILGKWINDPNGKILICEDKEIFIFSAFIDLEVFKRLRERLNDMIDSASDKSIASFYDLDLNAQALTALANQRLQNKKSLHDEKRKNLLLNAVPNPELVSSLPARRAARNGMNIMVIEDDPFSRRLISIALKSEFPVSFAESGVTGIADYLTLAPDMVFLDLGLPDLDGIEVLKKIKLIDPQAFIVVLSGNGHKENIMQAVRAGAKGFIGKPFTRDKLFQYINANPKMQKSKPAPIYTL